MCRPCSTREGEPLRLGVEAEPFLVSPNQAEAEALVGQEFHDDEDFLLALDGIADLGARNVLITTEQGRSRSCARTGTRVATARSRRGSIPSRASAAATRCSPAFLAARHAGRSNEESLRAAVAAGAASTLEVGAGRFDPRQAGRLQAGVELLGARAGRSVTRIRCGR